MKIFLLTILLLSQSAFSLEIFWHRGDVNTAQENSLDAINSSLDSPHPNVEIDVISYTFFGKQSAVVAHDKKAKRIAGIKGNISDYDFKQLLNSANSELSPEQIISFEHFLDTLVIRKKAGEKFKFIVDIKLRWGLGYRFSAFIANEVMKRDLVAEALFLGWKRSVCKRVRKICKQCNIGIITKAPLLKRNKPKRKYMLRSKLDGTSMRNDYQFVVLKDTELFLFPDVVTYWKQRGIKVAAYSSDMEQEYTAEQLEILKHLDFVILDSKQINQF